MNTDSGESKIRQDRIRGCLFGGAVGDALGYPVEFLSEEEIFSQYGPEGIRQYHIDKSIRPVSAGIMVRFTFILAGVKYKLRFPPKTNYKVGGVIWQSII